MHLIAYLILWWIASDWGVSAFPIENRARAAELLNILDEFVNKASWKTVGMCTEMFQ